MYQKFEIQITRRFERILVIKCLEINQDEQREDEIRQIGKNARCDVT